MELSEEDLIYQTAVGASHHARLQKHRSWATEYRGPFLIHASLNIDRAACKKRGIDPRKLETGVRAGPDEGVLNKSAAIRSPQIVATDVATAGFPRTSSLGRCHQVVDLVCSPGRMPSPLRLERTKTRWDNFKNTQWDSMERLRRVGQDKHLKLHFYLRPPLGTTRCF